MDLCADLVDGHFSYVLVFGSVFPMFMIISLELISRNYFPGLKIMHI